MGKRSQRRMTGKTYKQRVKKPEGNSKFEETHDAIKEVEHRNKEVNMFKFFRKMMVSGRMGKSVAQAAKIHHEEVDEYGRKLRRGEANID